MNVVLSYGLGVDSTALLLRWLEEPTSRVFELSDRHKVLGRGRRLPIVARLRRAGGRRIARPQGAGPTPKEPVMAKRTQRRKLTEEERAQKRAAERELMAKAIEELRSSEGWQRWLSVRRHFHSYSFHNQLLIAFQRPGATRVAGFRRWLELGYAVRKGERGISIWAPCPPPKKKLREWHEAGADPDEKPRTFFRLVKVFDRSQVSPLPEFPGGPLDLDPPLSPVEGSDLVHLQEPLVDFAASIGVPVSFEPLSDGFHGYYHPSKKRIVIAAEAGISANSELSTLIHELSHALVRCERQEGDPKLTYSEEEVVVECVAYTVCSTVGLDTAGYSVPYMTSWSQGGEIERYAGLIDRLASRLEDAAAGGEAGKDEPRVAPALA